MLQILEQLLLPGLLVLVCALAMAGRRDAYALLVTGAEDGLKTVVRILPPLVVLLSMVQMLRTSGALEMAAQLLAPVCAPLGLPPELLPLMVIRPISGSAGLAVGSELIAHFGPDSELGRITAVMMGCTETTFYTISVYFGAAGIRRTRYTVPAALVADLTGFLLAPIWVKLLF